jgi:3-dehydroquinate dehydratase/shikimate dehydrogenase
MLAVAFGPPNMTEASAGLARISQQADCVELRLDLFQEPFDLDALLSQRGDLKVVATLRPPDQGGRSVLSADERLKVLVKAAELGADYVDLEYNAADPAALEAVRAAGAQVILSRHDFTGMPQHLADDWWPRLAELGADVVKVVGTAVHLCDCLQVLRALEQADRPTIAIAMGEKGLLSRVLALRFDQCLLTYAALDDAAGTAPGQLSVSEMRQTYRADRIGSRTRVFGLLGPHVESERLREYNTWFASDGLDGVVVPFLASDGAAEILSQFRELPVSGWHVHGETLQRAVIPALDDVKTALNKVNAVVRRQDGGLIGHWVESPRQQYALWAESG